MQLQILTEWVAEITQLTGSGVEFASSSISGLVIDIPCGPGKLYRSAFTAAEVSTMDSDPAHLKHRLRLITLACQDLVRNKQEPA